MQWGETINEFQRHYYSFLACGVACLISGFIPDSNKAKIPLVLIGKKNNKYMPNCYYLQKFRQTGLLWRLLHRLRLHRRAVPHPGEGDGRGRVLHRGEDRIGRRAAAGAIPAGSHIPGAAAGKKKSNSRTHRIFPGKRGTKKAEYLFLNATFIWEVFSII